MYLEPGSYLCELAFEAYEVDFGRVCPKVVGDVQIYTVYAVELCDPAQHLSVIECLQIRTIP